MDSQHYESFTFTQADTPLYGITLFWPLLLFRSLVEVCKPSLHAGHVLDDSESYPKTLEGSPPHPVFL